MAKQTLTVNIHVTGVRETLKAFARLPKAASDEIRDASLALSGKLAVDIASAARASGGQAALMAPTVKAVRDRVPAVTAGGAKRVGRHKVSAWRILFASEFGMNKRSGWYAAAQYAGSPGRQYPPHVGRHSYWFFATVDAHEREISQAWSRVADEIVRAWKRDGV